MSDDTLSKREAPLANATPKMPFTEGGPHPLPEWAAPTTLEQVQQIGEGIQRLANAVGDFITPKTPGTLAPVGSLVPPFQVNPPFYVGDDPYQYMGPPVYPFQQAPDSFPSSGTKVTVTYPPTTALMLTRDELRMLIREEVRAALQELEDDPTPNIVTVKHGGQGEPLPFPDDSLLSQDILKQLMDEADTVEVTFDYNGRCYKGKARAIADA